MTYHVILFCNDKCCETGLLFSWPMAKAKEIYNKWVVNSTVSRFDTCNIKLRNRENLDYYVDFSSLYDRSVCELDSFEELPTAELIVTVETTTPSSLTCDCHQCDGQIAVCYCIQCALKICDKHQQVSVVVDL